jgi:PIN domain nuclease of toxin-antitoxin system
VTVLLDTHALLWWTSDPDRLSMPAIHAIEQADEVGVAAITWWELAWLVEHERVVTSIPARAWIADLARDVRTLPITPAIALGAAALPAPFPPDPADRIIYATAIEIGWRLVSKDRRLHAYDPGRDVVVW